MASFRVTDFVTNALRLGAEPRVSKGTDRPLLSLPGVRGYRALQTPSGALTDYGREYQRLSGKELAQRGYNPDQLPERSGSGDVETIRMRDGTRKITRTWDAAAERFKYTATGRSFYDKVRVEYTIMLPVRVHLTRDNGLSLIHI